MQSWQGGDTLTPANDGGHRYGATALTAAAIFAFMLALNHWMPLHRDDYDYMMVWKTGVPIASLSDVLSSAMQHYLLHGGRMVTVFCLDLFLWLGKPLFDAANALMFLALSVLVMMHARRSAALTQTPGLLAAAALLLWLSLPHFGEVAVWKSGSTVYLWSAVPAFLFLLPYNLALKAMGEGQRARHAWASMPMFLLGILAGWSIENLAVTVTLLALGCTLYARRHGAFAPWMLTGALGALAGLIGLVAAPGNYVRYDAQGADKGILIHLGNQIAGQGEMLLYLLPVLLLIYTAYRLRQRRLSGLPAVVHGSLILYAGKKHVVAFDTGGITTVSVALWSLLLLLTASYFTGGWVASAIRDAVIAGVLTPLGQTRPKTIFLFTNVMNGFEEMAIYWLAILLCYHRMKELLGLTAASVRAAAQQVSWREVLRASPAARYAACLIGARTLQQSRHDRRANLPGTCHVQLRRHVRRGTARPAERSIGAQRILPPGMPPAAHGGVPPPRLYGCGGAPSHTRDGGRGRGTDRPDRGRPCTRRDRRSLPAHREHAPCPAPRLLRGLGQRRHEGRRDGILRADGDRGSPA